MPGDYPFENLGDERFQQLCQALLARERPTVQCFPVGQADGGRDAVAYISGRDRPFVVYQVKFNGQGSAARNPRDWLRRSLAQEIPKVVRLAELGATEYVVMTNVQGTGHSDGGSIDRIDDLLAEHLPIPAFCMWRDDLSRRLDGAWDLKWAYPEVMTGPDLLRAVIEAGVAEDRTRRANALRAFLASQYNSDQQVRFRQVDLESPLLDLFIDVPLTGLGQDVRSSQRGERRTRGRLLHAMLEISRDLAAEAHRKAGEEVRNTAELEQATSVGDKTSTTFDESSAASSRRSAGASIHFADLGGAAWAATLDAKVYAEFGNTWAHAPDTGQLSIWNDEEFDRFYDEHSRAMLLEPTITLGAAAFLAHPLAARRFPAIVLEGAPGQGKSTVTQYLCQVHRMRLLDKSADIARLPDAHRPRSARLPLRADLRDLAAWLGGRDPFRGSPAGATYSSPQSCEPTLEAFLAALISHQSGASRFDVSDLQEVARVSALLIVLDGLDEVADPKRRTAVVKTIQEGTQRLDAVAASLQVIVTSRPAAFATSPGLPEAEFPRLQLGPVTKALALAYADRWLAARRVAQREATEFRAAVTAKLDLPHLSELARNPMQLAILLSLLNTRGVSLPDKRTALYTSYIDVFFGREAEKSIIVRDNRDLLLALHGYLAWLLHAEAETTEGDERGRITQQRLRTEVRAYLEADGHDAQLVDGLFAGVVERVVALVSRVQGTFEFEVQPLREYFAGRHLYETARYSRAGDENRGGTKPDRFDQIARNPYWLNVTRFFAGFFDKGELPMLVERLQDLADDVQYRGTSHPATVAATLLTDWVFAQTPRTVGQVAALVLDPPRLKVLLAGAAERGAAGDPLSLANECGRVDVLDRVFDELQSEPPWDYRQALIGLGRANSNYSEREARWIEVAAQTDSSQRVSRYAWLHTGWSLNVLDRVPAEKLATFLGEAPTAPREALLIAQAGRNDVMLTIPGCAEAAVDGVLSGLYSMPRGAENGTLLNALSWAFDPDQHVRFASRAHLLWQEDWHAGLLGGLWRPDRVVELDAGGLQEDLAARVRAVVTRAAVIAQRPPKEWVASIEPWEELVEVSRAQFGERWAHVLLAAEAAVIRPPRLTKAVRTRTETENGLLDHNQPLVRRVWYARRKANDPRWWEAQLAGANSDYDRALLVALVGTWASSKVIEANESALDDAVRALAPRWWFLVASYSHRISQRQSRNTGSEPNPGKTRLLARPPRSDLDLRTLALLRFRLKPEQRRRLYRERLQSYRGLDYYVLDWAQSEALDALASDPESWDAPLRTIAAAYAAGAYPVTGSAELGETFSSERGTAAAADEVLGSPKQYPQGVIAAAERRVRQNIGLRLTPVSAAATREGWFEP